MTTLTLPNVENWMKASQIQVLDFFHGLPSAFSDGEDQERFVYIEGTRDDRVLLVAHADTVWGTFKIDTYNDNGTIRSRRALEDVKFTVQTTKGPEHRTRKGIGIGADCRAGTAILWALRKLGHSLLITSGEEYGGLAAKRIMRSDWWQKELAQHQFAIEFDRMNKNDVVFYDIATELFANYVTQETQYVPASGTYTDVRDLCVDICGVNISVGYYDQHKPSEHLVMSEWQKTLEICHAWLSKPNLPKFALDRTNWRNRYELPKKKRKCTQPQITNTSYNPNFSNNIIPCALANGDLKCPYCHTVLSESEWFKNIFKCTKCKTEI